jgi:diguanylate cyclase (GGDEF)-like protein/PAS domain S-box-containing protein
MTAVARMLYVAVIGIILFVNQLSIGAAAQERNILLLNSYHRALPWTDSQTEGILNTFRSSGYDATVFIEYLDWKNNPRPEQLNLLAELYRSKYAQKQIDLILTTDDVALQFALQYRDDVFNNAPIVFSGVHQDAAVSMIQGQRDVTGVLEKMDAEKTLQLMLRFNPKLEKLYLIYDNTESGAITENVVREAAQRIRPDLKIVHQNRLSYAAITEQLKIAPDNSAVLISSYSRDIDGVTLELEHFVKLFAEASRVPVYVLYDFEIGNGAVGGSVLSGPLQGEYAAQLGLRILRGERVPELPMVITPTTETVIDYAQLQRYGLSENQIPAGSKIINQPITFYRQYQSLVWSIISLFVVMTVFIIVLLENISRRKAAENCLKQSNEELTALTEEMLASQEELQDQYEQLRVAEEALRESENRYKLSLEGANDGLWDWDICLDVVFLSARCLEMLGANTNRQSFFGQWLKSVVPPEEIDQVLDALHRHLEGHTPYYICEHRIETPGGMIWVLARGKALLSPSGHPVRMAGSITDITARKEQEASIKYLAFHDILTGIPNRAALDEKLSGLLAGKIAGGSTGGSLMLLDLDDFKVINDIFGHSYGDRLLRTISGMFREIRNDHTFIARMGGDEFVILCEDITEREEVRSFAQKVLDMFGKPVSVDDKSFHISISMGLTVFPADGNSFDQLVKNADLAMYKAKEEGKNRYAFFEQALDETVRQKMMLEQDLRNAIRDDELCLWYQPQFDAVTGKITGFEALLRWLSKKEGMIMPGRFIGLAEESGLIVPIGYWILEEACAFINTLHRQGYCNLKVSVNVSVVQLMQSDFLERVQRIADTAGIPPGTVGIEITESILMESLDANIKKLNDLREAGFTIYLDDFGTGYSSLKYLRCLPIDILKIDKTFIDGLLTDGDRDLTGSMIDLAHRIGLKAVAEGVETEQQLAKLQAYECDFVQGYLLSRPVPESEVVKLLEQYGEKSGI